MHAFAHSCTIELKAVRSFIRSRVHARMNGITATHTAIVSTYLHNVS
jgi:hypothetical protein